MLMSILFAAVGVCGALYSFAVALMGLIHGPYCKYNLIVWGTPFKNQYALFLSPSLVGGCINFCVVGSGFCDVLILKLAL